MRPAAGVDNHPKDPVVFIAAVVFVSGVDVAGVVVVVLMGTTGHLEVGLIRESPRGIGGGRSGVISLMRLTVAKGHRGGP